MANVDDAKSINKPRSTPWAALILSSSSFVYVIWAFVFAPNEFDPPALTIIRFTAALAAGLFGYSLLTFRSIGGMIDLSSFHVPALRFVSAATLFVVTLAISHWPLFPIGRPLVPPPHDGTDYIESTEMHARDARNAYEQGIQSYRAGDLATASQELQRAILLGYKPEPNELDPRTVVREIKEELLTEFQWPPPAYSAIAKVPMHFFREHQCKSLGDVGTFLERSLGLAGFPRYGYYRIPSGFALVAQLERIEDDGSPFSDDRRFEFSMRPPSHFTLGQYISALFKARSGRYRIIVFAITSTPAFGSSSEVSADTARRWPTTGASDLPLTIANEELTSDFRCLALIYEFSISNADVNKVELVLPSKVAGEDHLSRAKIINPKDFQ